MTSEERVGWGVVGSFVLIEGIFISSQVLKRRNLHGLSIRVTPLAILCRWASMFRTRISSGFPKLTPFSLNHAMIDSYLCHDVLGSPIMQDEALLMVYHHSSSYYWFFDEQRKDSLLVHGESFSIIMRKVLLILYSYLLELWI